MKVPYHALRATELGVLSCLCSILVFSKARAVHYSNFFFFFLNIRVQLRTTVCALGLGRFEGYYLSGILGEESGFRNRYLWINTPQIILLFFPTLQLP